MHSSIYIFGGGASNKTRFNDVLKLDLTYSNEGFVQCDEVGQDSVRQPDKRTYHAATLVSKFIVTCGGEGRGDLNDFWAFDIQRREWCQPEVQGKETFCAKRFHTMTTIQDTKAITFGGCHSDYVFLNDINLFDLTSFLKNPARNPIICTKINPVGEQPSKRWGHSACAYKDEVYIFGGRNDLDVNDIWKFKTEDKRWEKVIAHGAIPTARRRHSSVFVSSAFVMFGGFDASFYSDIHIIDFLGTNKRKMTIDKSTYRRDYQQIYREGSSTDLTLLVKEKKFKVNRGLLLSRIVQREFDYEIDKKEFDGSILQYIDTIIKSQECEFYKQILSATPGS